MDKLVPTHADRRTVLGPGRGGAPGGGDDRGAGAAPFAAAGASDGRTQRETFARVLAATCAGPERATDPGLPGAGLAVATMLRASRAYGRSDEPRTGRPPAGSGAAASATVPVGHRVDIAA